jgi:hypothetical protein
MRSDDLPESRRIEFLLPGIQIKPDISLTNIKVVHTMETAFSCNSEQNEVTGEIVTFRFKHSVRR